MDKPWANYCLMSIVHLWLFPKRFGEMAPWLRR